MIVDQPNATFQFEPDDLPAREARYYSGWWFSYPYLTPGNDSDAISHRRIEAYLRPDSADWYDLYAFDHWWQAQAFAMNMAATMKDCIYEGGPKNG